MRILSLAVAIAMLSLTMSAMSADSSPPTAKQPLAALSVPTGQNNPWVKFHSQVTANMSSDAAISPDIVNSTNPHVKPYAAIVAAARWDIKSIPVCWENPSASSVQAMGWVRDAVTRTWEQASAIKFTGWTSCAKKNNGIRIQIADTGPHVKKLGQQINDTKNGMVLNFTFNNWSPSCQENLESCIRSIAVHEFGHAIGLTHEQNRPDAPGECATLAQGGSPDTALTPYDPSSVMNYCNKKWNNDGFLSELDIAGVQALYGKPQS